MTPEHERGVRHSIALQAAAVFTPKRVTLTKWWSPWNPADMHLFKLLERSRPGSCVADFYNQEALDILKRWRT